ncbi:hypothetical protein G7074_02485 [Pedobacter sp. HDW13]|uniref:hypothetical protein n=1 Tax=unclassified Pedobacter TaxID=2628915 RepID=UPI000F5B65FF|nr:MULTISPECIES: hypothetical protein [unclassified Pedobacter]QIL38244.1 hypothetical protein G7074_02485 [Pedobacter sp. HDW13]RQO73679.1 hypothetical protein DBR40_12745 [Pedobacter sp. KBW01]
MPLLLTPNLDILDAIKQLDKLLRTLNIVPVLEYQKIRYKLDQDNELFMTISLTANHISYEKLYLPENNEKFNAVFNRIEAFIFLLRRKEILQAS